MTVSRGCSKNDFELTHVFASLHVSCGDAKEQRFELVGFGGDGKEQRTTLATIRRETKRRESRKGRGGQEGTAVTLADHYMCYRRLASSASTIEQADLIAPACG